MNITNETLKNGIKNPLGIIGLFLVITEAIASMVILNSELNDALNLILVLFIVTFPFAVLIVFYRLVAYYHKNLYSPSDYKDENNFVTTYEYNSITKQKEKTISEEIMSTKKENKEVNTGMTVEDVDFLKNALLSIMDTQTQMISNQEAINVIAERRNILEESIDDYIFEKEEYELHVDVSKIARCKKLVSELRQKYTANIYEFSGREEKYGKNREHESIWLGDMVPIEMAIDVIKVARSFMPHLKYILISDGSHLEPEYIRYEIFIGGSTQTAVERNLHKMTEADFSEIYQMTDIKSLHEFVRNKNQQ